MKGRKPHNDPPVKVHISLPTSLVAKVELSLFDPARGRIRYGGLSELLQSLLTRWLDDIKNGPITQPLTGHSTSEETNA